jgi:hypothetical protein
LIIKRINQYDPNEYKIGCFMKEIDKILSNHEIIPCHQVLHPTEEIMKEYSYAKLHKEYPHGWL